MKDLRKYLSRFSQIRKPQYYEEWVKHFQAMIVHTRKAKPSDLLLSIRPNEQQEVFDYRINNHRAITYASMIKSFDRLFRIFNTLNFSWNAPTSVTEYINKTKFNKHSFEQFMSQNVLKACIDDPNGLLVWLPDGDGLIEKTKKVAPRPELVNSEDIKVYDDDVLIYKTHIDILKYIDEVSDDDLIYESYVVLTRESYGFFFYFEDESKDYYHEMYLLNGFDELPVIQLGGIDCGGYYESFFSPFLEFGNEAIARFSDWQGVTVMCGYPQIDELELECQAKGCVEGYIGKGEKRKVCSSCHGTGAISGRTPFGVTKRRVPDIGDEDPSLNIPSRRFNSPDTAILKTLDDNWKTLLKMGEDALHLVYTQEAQSGIAKDIDREDGDSTINKISDRHFDIHWWYSLKYIGMYLTPNNFQTEGITISKPLSFRLRGVSDLLEEIATLKEKNAPIILVLNVVKELFEKRFSYDEVSLKIFNVIFENDPLSVYSVDESQTLILSNSIQPESMTNNLYLFQTLLKISKEMKSEAFVKAENDLLYKKALDLMKGFYSKPITPINEPFA